MSLIMTDDIVSLLETPCKELKPVEPFPFKSNRISRGVRFQHYLILFPFYPEYKKCQHLYTFNLSTHKWGSVQLRNSPQILENTDNYKIIADEKDGFILVGCYKESQANTTGNLFFQSQATTVKKALGKIQAKIDEGESILQWEEMEAAEQLPYREKFSATLIEKDLYIFGGCDENGTLMKDLFRYSFGSCTVNKIELTSRHWGGNNNLPCARMSHGSPSRKSVIIFGGEDSNSNIINDIWTLRSGRTSNSQCFKFNRNPISRCPKLDTPSLWFGPFEDAALIYIAKSTIQALPPFKNYICAEKFFYPSEQSTAWSQKEPLPFDGVPHTMEIFEDQLILGFEASIYSIPFVRISPAYDFEKAEDEDEDENEGVLTKKTRPKSYKGHMRQYFEERPFPDVTFKVQGEEVNAHRGILSVRCPFFHESFCNESSEEHKSKPMEITDLSLEEFNTLLEWLYCNEIVDFKEEVAIQILKTTSKYGLPKLKTEAERCLVKNLTTETILQRAKLAVEFNARDLETAVVNFIVKGRGEMNKKEELEDLPDSIRERVSNIEMRGKR